VTRLCLCKSGVVLYVASRYSVVLWACNRLFVLLNSLLMCVTPTLHNAATGLSSSHPATHILVPPQQLQSNTLPTDGAHFFALQPTCAHVLAWRGRHSTCRTCGEGRGSCPQFQSWLPCQTT